MKVVLLKRYSKKSEVYVNYGDDVVEVWHNLQAIEEVKEVSEEEFEVLKRAVEYFNKNGKKRDFMLDLSVVAQEDEVRLLVEDLLKYEADMAKKMEAERLAAEKKRQEEVAREQARKKERTVKKLAKELNLSIEAVQEMLKNKS